MAQTSYVGRRGVYQEPDPRVTRTVVARRGVWQQQPAAGGGGLSIPIADQYYRTTRMQG